MKNSGCFCYLVNHEGNNSVDTCKQSLKLLNDNYLDNFPAPVILFHEAGFTDKMKQELMMVSKAALTFIPIKFEIPPQVKEIRQHCRIGYMHMCRFFANEIFKQPILDDFEYYCRLDTDSFILSPVTSNIFEDAKTNNIKYGFINDSILDRWKYVTGLWKASDNFVANNPDLKCYRKLYTDIKERRVYYTNFELCYVPWFRGNTWQSYFKEIDDLGGIYKHRWGDHTIRYIGVNLFMSPDNIKRITNIHYSHQGVEDNKPKT